MASKVSAAPLLASYPIPLMTRWDSSFSVCVGILADQGLHDFALCLGREWVHLASLLNVPTSQIDHLRLDYPNDTRLQIFYMLRYWRDREVGSKEIIKGRLHKALCEIRRLDLAQQLMQEQVDGSVERMAGFTSII